MNFPLTAYLEAAMELAVYEKLEDGSYAGEIPKLPGVIAFDKTLRDCERELRSTLEDWLLVGLRLDHKLFTMETMKMRTTNYAAIDGVVSEINVQVGENVESKYLLAKLRV